MADRVKHALVKHVLEPAWEAAFEPNSDGFRPGRSTGDAIGAINVQINQKPTWVWDADIAQCFDRINHEAVLRKLDAPPPLSRQIKAWLKGGWLDKGIWFPPSWDAARWPVCPCELTWPCTDGRGERASVSGRGTGRDSLCG
jgi:RNA-directed DNA polymerase